jgi:hypothetical protein
LSKPLLPFVPEHTPVEKGWEQKSKNLKKRARIVFQDAVDDDRFCRALGIRRVD